MDNGRCFAQIPMRVRHRKKEAGDAGRVRRHDCRRAPGARELDDGLRLSPGVVGGRIEEPHLPDVDLHVRVGRARQALLRGGVWPARGSRRREGRPDLLTDEQPRPGDPGGSADALGRCRAGADVLERYGGHCHDPARPPSRRRCAVAYGSPVRGDGSSGEGDPPGVGDRYRGVGTGHESRARSRSAWRHRLVDADPA